MIKFNQAVKHGRHQFLPGVTVDFADDSVEDYFVAAGWASVSNEASVFTYDDVEVDPLTRFAEDGKYVQPKLAEAALADTDYVSPSEKTFQAGLIAPENANG